MCILTVKKFRHAFAQFRTGVHSLEIERGRYSNTPRHDRVCKLCSQGEVEDEEHFLLKCTAFASLRQKYIPSKYYNTSSVHNMHILLASRNETIIKNTAMYIYYSMMKRKNLYNILQ